MSAEKTVSKKNVFHRKRPAVKCKAGSDSRRVISHLREVLSRMVQKCSPTNRGHKLIWRIDAF